MQLLAGSPEPKITKIIGTKTISGSLRSAEFYFIHSHSRLSSESTVIFSFCSSWDYKPHYTIECVFESPITSVVSRNMKPNSWLLNPPLAEAKQPCQLSLQSFGSFCSLGTFCPKFTRERIMFEAFYSVRISRLWLGGLLRLFSGRLQQRSWLKINIVPTRCAFDFVVLCPQTRNSSIYIIREPSVIVIDLSISLWRLYSQCFNPHTFRQKSVYTVKSW